MATSSTRHEPATDRIKAATDPLSAVFYEAENATGDDPPALVAVRLIRALLAIEGE